MCVCVNYFTDVYIEGFKRGSTIHHHKPESHKISIYQIICVCVLNIYELKKKIAAIANIQSFLKYNSCLILD